MPPDVSSHDLWSPDLWSVYALMLKSRLLEEAIAGLWHDGLISGEMHLGTGEEAIIAGVVSQLRPGDALALDHRGTAALVMRGVDPVLILRELLGREDGLCGGMGGHMHLFSREHLAATSGIVGAVGPSTVGFALSAQVGRPGAVAVGFSGEAAMNQGMSMEALNLASVWRLPAVFVCKDDGWGITTRGEATAGDISKRATAFDISTVDVDGRDVAAVWEAAAAAIERGRAGHGPTFIHARCVHLDAHFLGFPLVRMIRDPLAELPKVAGPLTRSFVRRGGAPFGQRWAGMKQGLSPLGATWRDPRRDPANDPVGRARKALAADPARLQELEERIRLEVQGVVASSLAEAAL